MIELLNWIDAHQNVSLGIAIVTVLGLFYILEGVAAVIRACRAGDGE